jgi:hypothetical protein
VVHLEELYPERSMLFLEMEAGRACESACSGGQMSVSSPHLLQSSTSTGENLTVTLADLPGSIMPPSGDTLYRPERSGSEPSACRGGREEA